MKEVGSQCNPQL